MGRWADGHGLQPGRSSLKRAALSCTGNQHEPERHSNGVNGIEPSSVWPNDANSDHRSANPGLFEGHPPANWRAPMILFEGIGTCRFPREFLPPRRAPWGNDFPAYRFPARPQDNARHLYAPRPTRARLPDSGVGAVGWHCGRQGSPACALDVHGPWSPRRTRPPVGGRPVVAHDSRGLLRSPCPCPWHWQGGTSTDPRHVRGQPRIGP